MSDTEKKKPQLGDPVEFTAVLIRNRSADSLSWITSSVPARRGVYMGSRTVYEGRVRGGGSTGLEGEYEAPYFCHDKSITHALVVVHERRAPVRVPFSALELKP